MLNVWKEMAREKKRREDAATAIDAQNREDRIASYTADIEAERPIDWIHDKPAEPVPIECNISGLELEDACGLYDDIICDYVNGAYDDIDFEKSLELMED